MPLIVIVGAPCAGKTTYAGKIKEYLQKEKQAEVILVNEENLGLNKMDFYKDSNSEKMLRAKLKSEVEKWLDDKRFVIMDSLNYIKGYRYELYCLVRNFKTTLCVIYLPRSLDFCLNNNNKIVSINSEKEITDNLEVKLDSLNIAKEEINQVYKEDMLKDLYSRMEEPIAKNRWDSPLYQIYQDEEVPYEEIHTNLVSGKRPAYAISTHTEKQFDSNYLQELESSCGEINNQILAQQSSDNTIIKIETSFIYLKKSFSGTEMKKIKQEFIKICKMHPPKNKETMIKNYIDYINTIQERF